jgi:hypothetical protein
MARADFFNKIGTRQTKAELLHEQSEANIPAGSRKGSV